MKFVDIARTINPSAAHKITGIRPGEKLREQMIGPENAPYTYEYPDYFKILPMIHDWCSDPYRIEGGKRVGDAFGYCSDTNSERMGSQMPIQWLQAYPFDLAG